MMRPGFTDICSDGWLERQLPAWARPYAQLMRLDRPIGTWLLLLPCWWGLALAAPRFPHIGYMFLFALGAIVMRGAGCVINDIYDRDLDARVERTRSRPLASGEIGLWQAILLLIGLLLAGLIVLLFFNTYTAVTAMLSLGLVFTYPLMKRITWWPQLFLGITFNWGALLGWTAIKAGLGVPAILLYAAGIFWTLGYDTVYAHQDKRDDALAGMKSTALLFGDGSLPWVALFYLLALVCVALAGWSVHLGRGFYAVLIVAAGYAAFELARWRMDDPENCLRRFRNNRDFGLLIFAAIVLGHYL
ncbi:MAG: 4-hydroxybenzoate octaprenyltransferase [Bdellovibrionales bacterium]